MKMQKKMFRGGGAWGSGSGEGRVWGVRMESGGGGGGGGPVGEGGQDGCGRRSEVSVKIKKMFSGSGGWGRVGGCHGDVNEELKFL